MKLAETELNREVVSEAEWLIARKDLLTREREFTRQRDALSAARRQLPMVKIDKEYVFDGPNGKESLADLFDGRSQMIVYHFMFGPDWEEGCKSCSYLADHFDGANWHLPHRDVTFVAISRAPSPKLQAYKKRLGWRFKWVSSHGNNFNFDYHVSFTKEEEKKNKVYYNYTEAEFISDELPGLSVFYKDEDGDIFHTYSTYARGLDPLVGTYNFLDLVEHEGTKYHHLCKITEVMPQKKIAYTWRYAGEEGNSLVTFELFADGGKTRLKLTHEGLETFPKLPAYAKTNFEKGWTEIIGSSLKQYVEESKIS